MNRNLFQKFEEKKILEESSVNILGGGHTYPGNDSSGETGDNKSTGFNGGDCADDTTTDPFEDAIFTGTNNDAPDDTTPAPELGISPRP